MVLNSAESINTTKKPLLERRPDEKLRAYCDRVDRYWRKLERAERRNKLRQRPSDLPNYHWADDPPDAENQKPDLKNKERIQISDKAVDRTTASAGLATGEEAGGGETWPSLFVRSPLQSKVLPGRDERHIRVTTLTSALTDCDLERVVIGQLRYWLGVMWEKVVDPETGKEVKGSHRLPRFRAPPNRVVIDKQGNPGYKTSVEELAGQYWLNPTRAEVYRMNRALTRLSDDPAPEPREGRTPEVRRGYLHKVRRARGLVLYPKWKVMEAATVAGLEARGARKEAEQFRERIALARSGAVMFRPGGLAERDNLRAQEELAAEKARQAERRQR